MKENITTILLRLLVAVVVFVLSFAFFNYRDVREKGEAVAEMSNPSYPVMELVYDGISYDLMSGYRGDVDLSLVRNNIALTDSSGMVGLRLHTFDYDITAIHYSLFTRSPEDPLEEGTLNRLEHENEENVKTASLSFETEIKSGKTYYLQLVVRLDQQTQVSYYTKLMNGAGRHFSEYVNFAGNFHNNLFDDKTIEENAIYLEPSDNVRESTIENVDIHSSLSAIYFGSAVMSQQEEPRISICEVNDTYTVLQMKTVVSSQQKQEYDMTEYYKLRYTADRMYLLDYDRTLDAYYNEELIDEKESTINLGVQDINEIDCFSADEGKKVSFSQQGQLWYYDYQNSNVTNVYSFVPEMKTDLHNDNSSHGIKILDMDSEGNIIYLAYGYINRGHREGQNGILVMRYRAGTNVSEEMVFLETSLPCSRMKEDLKRLAYLNEEDKFYCCLEGTLYEIDLVEKTFHSMRENLEDQMLTASRKQNIIALQKDKDLMKSREVELLNLDTGMSKNIQCSDGRRISAIGFLAEDFIYGEAEEENIGIQSDGSIFFPMSLLRIVNSSGKEIKTYKKSGRFFLDTRIEGNVLEMSLARRKKSGSIKPTQKHDYIRYKEKESGNEASLVYLYSNIYWNQLHVRFPEYVYIQIKPDVLTARIMTREDSPLMTLDGSEGNVIRYYVYASGEETGSFRTLASAIMSASDQRGQVVDSREQVLWECAFPSYMKVAGMENVVKVSSKKKSLAGCLSMIASVNGIDAAPGKIDTRAGNPASLLEKYSGHEVLNLTGCTTDQILYYVSKGCPVLTKYSGRHFVVIMSYNSTNIRYLDPVSGLSTSVDRAGLTEKLHKAGDVYYSYLEEMKTDTDK